MSCLRTSMWNANGVSRYKLGIIQFLIKKHIDVMLLADTHLTGKLNFQVRGYTSYCTNHRDGKALSVTGNLFKKRIKHHRHQRCATNYLQATSIKLLSGNNSFTIAAVYCPSYSNGWVILGVLQFTWRSLYSRRRLQYVTHALGPTTRDPQRKATIWAVLLQTNRNSQKIIFHIFDFFEIFITYTILKINKHLYQDLAEKKYFFNYKKKTNFKNFPCLRIYISSCSYPIDFIFFLYLVL